MSGQVRHGIRARAANLADRDIDPLERARRFLRLGDDNLWPEEGVAARVLGPAVESLP